MNASPIPISSPVTLPPGPAAPASGRPRRWDPWPLGLILFFATFISGVAAFIVFAVSQRMDLVRPDYYEDEIRYQVQLNRLQRTRELGAAVGLAMDGPGRILNLRVPRSHVAAGMKGTVTLYRPSDARADRSMLLAPDAGGMQRVPLDGLGPGLWRMRVRWESGGLEYHVEDFVVLDR